MATLQDRYENLPGFKVEYQDNRLFSGNTTQMTNTKSMLILGSAVDGPVGEPISVNEIGVQEADQLFGGMIDPKTKEPHQGSLVRAMYEALRAGCEDVRLLRIDGRAARTELAAEDIARKIEQFLDNAQGNVAFHVNLQLPDDAHLIGPSKIEEVDKQGNVISHNPSEVVDYINTNEGNEAIYFVKNKFTPNNDLKVTYEYEVRTYTLVPRTDESGVPDYNDPDYILTRDPDNPRYFYSQRGNWSSKQISGHIPTVVVRDNTTGMTVTINSVTPTGEYIYRVGKGEVNDPLRDPWTDKDYQQGGIYFTSAYDQRVASGEYPDLNGDITVFVEYAWYTPSISSDEVNVSIPGQPVSYNLQYPPLSEEFKIYYEKDGSKVELVEGKDFTLSVVNQYVLINPGAAPVGARLIASYQTTNMVVQDPKLIVEGKYPGEVYGRLENPYDPNSITGVSVEVQVDPDPRNTTQTEKIIIFRKPEEKRLSYNDEALVYRTLELPQIKTIRQFVNYVNNDPKNNIVKLSAEPGHGEVPIQGLLPTNGPIYLGQEAPGVLKEDPFYPVGHKDRYPWLGDNGFYDVTNQEDMQRLFDRLGGKYIVNEKGEHILVEPGIYNLLENYVVDQIVLLDVYHNTVIDPDNPVKKFSTQLAQHCALVTAKTWETIGFIGVAPAPKSDLISLQNYIDELTKPSMNDHFLYNEVTFDQILDNEYNRIDIGRYIQVVFGPEVGMFNNKLSNYVTSGVVVYAALDSTLEPGEATTNKTLGGVLGLRYHLSEHQHNQLVGARYVTFQEKFGQGPSGLTRRFVVKDGVTAAQPGSDYTRLSTLNAVHATVQMVRQKADPFIGMPSGLAQRNALAAEIQAGLDALKERGVLEYFKFNIFASLQDKVLGNAFITLELVPAFETRKILTTVTLRPNA